MPVMRNFQKVLTRTQASYGLSASGQGANELPRVLRATRVERTPRTKAGQGNAGINRRNGWCAIEGQCAGGCGRKTEAAMNGEVVQALDLWAADAQTSRDIAAGRNRAGVRLEGCAAPTHQAGQENRAEGRETASAGCL